ncbi:hypothetical protein BKA67DRAFT_582232 [Truncatella angustata]|uniref:Uncharacterized protein n=1 Tax=Truncatella angustata TaxID=152316 RepID=A0A9P8UDE1_9PEZI|nr:uncharacterized protein BKA67DRAFT_582232 [Truncatella angustata]KAH6647287.1 hypothetical protein BKA67DRAFT_582232 [Truncatella angustata]
MFATSVSAGVIVLWISRLRCKTSPRGMAGFNRDHAQWWKGSLTIRGKLYHVADATYLVSLGLISDPFSSLKVAQ